MRISDDNMKTRIYVEFEKLSSSRVMQIKSVVQMDTSGIKKTFLAQHHIWRLCKLSNGLISCVAQL